MCLIHRLTVPVALSQDTTSWCWRLPLTGSIRLGCASLLCPDILDRFQSVHPFLPATRPGLCPMPPAMKSAAQMRHETRINVHCFDVTAHLFAGMHNPLLRDEGFSWSDFPEMAAEQCALQVRMSIICSPGKLQQMQDEARRQGRLIAQSLVRELTRDATSDVLQDAGAWGLVHASGIGVQL